MNLEEISFEKERAAVLAAKNIEIHQKSVAGSDWLIDADDSACDTRLYWMRDLSDNAGLPGLLALNELYVDLDILAEKVERVIRYGDDLSIYDPGGLIDDEVNVDWEGLYDYLVSEGVIEHEENEDGEFETIKLMNHDEGDDEEDWVNIDW